MAERRDELLGFLLDLGATADELVEHRDGLSGLASVLTIRGGPVLAVAGAAEQSGLPEEKLRLLSRAAGFPEPGPDDRLFAATFLEFASRIAAAEQLFGEDAVMQLVRVMGSAMSRVAGAVVSAFLVNVEPAAREADPVGLAVARANADAAALLPVVGSALDALLRQHLLAARRTILGDALDTDHPRVPSVVRQVPGTRAKAPKTSMFATSTEVVDSTLHCMPSDSIDS